MITIVNFSHPVEDSREDIARVCGLRDATEYKVVQVPVQVDRQQPMSAQCWELALEAIRQAGGNARNIDCIVLPGLSEAAVLILDYFRVVEEYLPNILRLAPLPGVTPPRFEAVEVVHLERPRQTREF